MKMLLYLSFARQTKTLDKLSDPQVAIDDITYFRPAKLACKRRRADRVLGELLRALCSALLVERILHAKKLAGTKIFSTSFECIAWSGTLETLGLPESLDWIEGQRQDAE